MSTSFFISGQKPADLDPLDFPQPLTTDPNDPGSEYNLVNALEGPIENTWFNELNPGTPVKVVRHDGLNSTDLSAHDVAEMIAEVINPNEEINTSGTVEHAEIAKLTSQLSIHAMENHKMLAEQIFLSQALGRQRLPAPSPMIRYTINQDVIPTAKTLLSSQTPSDWEMFFASVASIWNPRILGVAMLSEVQFEDFKTHLDILTSALGNKISSDTHAKLLEFKQIKLEGLTEALLLRNDFTDYTDDYSFARIITNVLRGFISSRTSSASGNTDTALMPFDLTQVIMAEAVVFVNVDAHAHASSKTIAKEWKLIVDSLNMVQPPLSLNKINKLTTATVQQQKMMADAVRAKKRMKDDAKKRETPPLISQQPTVPQIANKIDSVLTTMGKVQRSQNVFKQRTKTRAKPSRRRPDSIDARGTRNAKQYYPDIHFYADCSGSMTADNFAGITQTIAALASKRKINVYFTSFSHILSQDVMIKAANKTPQQIISIINSIPKVGGSTDFEIIWDHINESQARQNRMNIIATDFEFWPSASATHSPNTFYVPCDMGDWDRTKHFIEEFTERMMPFDATIPGRILGVY